MTKYSYIVGFLATGLMLISCSTFDEDAQNDVHEKVVAQISFSISGKNVTRMADNVVQANNNFLGMQEISLIPFAKGVAVNEPSEPIASGDHSIGSRILLADLGMNDLQINNKSKLYSNVYIPVGTNAFLVYGHSAHADNAYATNGKIVPAGLDGNPADMTFSLQPICSKVTNIGTEQTPINGAAGATGNKIVRYLNTIFEAQEGVFDWSSSSYPVLYGLYNVITSMKAGASVSVEAFVREIYDALKASAGVEYVKPVLKAILALDETDNLPATLPDAGEVALPDDCDGYPADCSLPDGTAVIQWNTTTKKYEAVTNQNNLGGLNVDVTNFTYPAELWYRCNSRINTDYESRADDYATETTWEGVLSTYLEKISAVNAATKSVAIRRRLEYAVSRLDLRLEAKNGNTALTELVDKAGTHFDLDDFSITGILVGQQSPVDYLFQSKWQQDGDPLYTIYDNAIVGTINAATNVYTHTLVLETAKNQPVNIAIELQNNSDESILTRVPGDTEDQIIPKGCKFYLVGTLNPVGQTGYNADGEDWQNRVFCQDHVTQVTFTVSDLTKAYYVIPPLSSTKLEFSLAVAKWKISTSVGGELVYNED